MLDIWKYLTDGIKGFTDDKKYVCFFIGICYILLHLVLIWLTIMVIIAMFIGIKYPYKLVLLSYKKMKKTFKKSFKQKVDKPFKVFGVKLFEFHLTNFGNAIVYFLLGLCFLVGWLFCCILLFIYVIIFILFCTFTPTRLYSFFVENQMLPGMHWGILTCAIK